MRELRNSTMMTMDGINNLLERYKSSIDIALEGNPDEFQNGYICGIGYMLMAIGLGEEALTIFRNKVGKSAPWLSGRPGRAQKGEIL